MKKPFVTLEQAKKIIEQYPTPFHIYDEKGIRENARRVYDAFSWNKGFKEYFAVKATPTPGILQVLKEEGCGMDCSSLTELMMSEAIGCKGHDIMFSSNVTPAEDFVKAAELGAIVNFDDITHIPFFEKLAPIPETVCCRFNPGGEFAIGNRIMDQPKDAKYGFTHEQIIEGYRILKEKGAKRIFNFATFGLFTEGCDKFDKAYEAGLISKIFTTNLIYRNPELASRDWYAEVNMCKYVSYIIDTLNHDESISGLLAPYNRINALLERHKKERATQLSMKFENK